MREYKFRGKRPFNGGWVYGFIMDWKGKRPSIFVQNGDVDEETGDVDYIDYTVDPETVGQYTGLHDKNGKEIYEGDIVKLSDTNPVLFKVEIVLGRFGYKTVFKHFDDGTITENYFLDKCEVVGSVWDNPELLKEVKTNV